VETTVAEDVCTALAEAGLTAASGESAGYSVRMRPLRPGFRAGTVLAWFQVPNVRNGGFAGWEESAEQEMQGLYAEILINAGFSAERSLRGFSLIVRR
jgi:hypothetical protein